MKLRFAMSAAVSAAVTLPLTLSLSACGSDQPAATGYLPSAPVTTTTAAPPQKAAPVAHLNRVTFVPAMNAAITKQKSWRITGSVTGGGQTLMTISGVQRIKPAAASVTMTGAAFNGGTARMISVGKTIYLSIPGMTPPGKYTKVTEADLVGRPELGQLFGNADPTKSFKSIGGALRSVRYVRSQTVDGTKLDQYEITLDSAKVLALAGQKKLPAELPKTFVYTVWMDSAHMIRKLTADLSGVSMEMTMTHFNRPVSITAPPASKIVKR